MWSVKQTTTYELQQETGKNVWLACVRAHPRKMPRKNVPEKSQRNGDFIRRSSDIGSFSRPVLVVQLCLHKVRMHQCMRQLHLVLQPLGLSSSVGWYFVRRGDSALPTTGLGHADISVVLKLGCATTSGARSLLQCVRSYNSSS